jgi:hypothetical protein
MLGVNVVAVCVLYLNGGLVAQFPSITAAASWMCDTQPTVSRAIKRGYTVKNLYRVCNH